MYQDEYENRGFPFRDFLLKLVILIVFIFLLVWLIPKFITPSIKRQCSGSSCVQDKKTERFNSAIKKMETAAISYYNDKNIPKDIGKSKKLTLNEMEKKGLISNLKNKKGKSYNKSKSYIKITKTDDYYILKINLNDGNFQDYKLIHLNHYPYCKKYLCEKKKKKLDNTSKPVAVTPISDENKNDSIDNNKGNKTANNNSSVNNKKVLYEYSKIKGIKLSGWSNWSALEKVDCQIKDIDCSDSDVNCLKKTKKYVKKEQVGFYDKKYVKTRKVLTKTSSTNQSACSNNNYVIINKQTYMLNGDWKLMESKKEFLTAPNDTERYRYQYVGVNFANCNDTCSSEPTYYYDVYKYVGTMTKVAGSTVSNKANCKLTKKDIPIYSFISTSEVSSRKEPSYETNCYQRIKTRSIIDSGKKSFKWSKYDDFDLLNYGWSYTGREKEVR